MRLLLLLLVSATTIFSQAQQITGRAKDENGMPLNGATVSLLRTKDSAVVKLAITKSDGAYNFSDIKEGSYKVLVSYVGYRPSLSPIFSFNSSNVEVAESKLFKL